MLSSFPLVVKMVVGSMVVVVIGGVTVTVSCFLYSMGCCDLVVMVVIDFVGDSWSCHI